MRPITKAVGATKKVVWTVFGVAGVLGVPFAGGKKKRGKLFSTKREKIRLSLKLKLSHGEVKKSILFFSFFRLQKRPKDVSRETPLIFHSFR